MTYVDSKTKLVSSVVPRFIRHVWVQSASWKKAEGAEDIKNGKLLIWFQREAWLRRRSRRVGGILQHRWYPFSRPDAIEKYKVCNEYLSFKPGLSFKALWGCSCYCVHVADQKRLFVRYRCWVFFVGFIVLTQFSTCSIARTAHWDGLLLPLQSLLDVTTLQGICAHSSYLYERESYWPINVWHGQKRLRYDTSRTERLLDQCFDRRSKENSCMELWLLILFEYDTGSNFIRVWCALDQLDVSIADVYGK